MVGTYVSIALQNLRLRKMKAFLTMLGIIIGIGSVVTIFSLSEGVQYMVLDQIRSYGSNVVIVLPGKSDDTGAPAIAQGIVVTTLTYKDALDIGNRALVPTARAVSAYVRGISTVSYQTVARDSVTLGTSWTFPLVEDVNVREGRFFTESEERTMANVVVLGWNVYRELFPSGGQVLGHYVRMHGQRFKIIGIMPERGVQSFENQDDFLFIPVTTAQRKLFGMHHVASIRARVDDPLAIPATITHIERILRINHRVVDPEDDDFSVRSSQQALEILGTILGVITVFLSFVAGISLLVGGIGIMNSMLMTVKERVKEIGLRKAIGAPPRSILVQFLIESAVLCGIGGVLGVLGGAVFSWVVAQIAVFAGYSWMFVLPWEGVILALGVACGVGLIFGYYPAVQAARLDPITALRTE